jgi:lipopolysaccharide export LptBFGC system permease protein LptF
MNNIINIFFIIGLVFVLFTIIIGIWSIITKRDKKYNEILEEYKKQKSIVEKELNKRRNENEKY